MGMHCDGVEEIELDIFISICVLCPREYENAVSGSPPVCVPR
jgi:hypothetical protein